jgi:hypothetical protein
MMAASQHFTAIYPFHFAGLQLSAYSAFYAFLLNLVVTVALSTVFNATGVARGTDHTIASDYVSDGVIPPVASIESDGAAPVLASGT